jgi:hypothetical protein
MPAHTFSAPAPRSSQDGPLVAEPRLVNLRSQVAVVRALADQVDHLTRAADVDGLGTQIVEEIGRLGCRLLDVAAAVAEASPAEGSGIFATMGALQPVTKKRDGYLQRSDIVVPPRH